MALAYRLTLGLVWSAVFVVCVYAEQESSNHASKEVFSLCYTKSLTGNIQSQYNLGLMYELGLGVEKNEKEASRWMRESAVGGFAEAQYKLARYYIDGFGVLMDLDIAHDWALKSFRQNNIDGILLLGEMNERGLGVQHNLNRAIYMYHFAASLGGAAAKHKLGQMYEGGRGVEADVDMALSFYKEAASMNHKESWFAMSSIYEEKGSPKESKRCLVNAAELGYVKAMMALAVKKSTNDRESFRWLEKAALASDREAMYLVALAYWKGKGVSFDLTKSLEWFLKSAHKNHPLSQHHLGEFYNKGYGVDKDIDKAALWFRRAFDSGYDLAGVELARLLTEHSELEKWYGSSLGYMASAAERGHPEAMYRIGRAHLDGAFGEIDFGRAGEYFSGSLDYGASCYALANMMLDGLIEAEYDRVIALYKRGASLGHVPSIVKLSELSDELKDSIKWIEKAAKMGDVESQYSYARYLAISGRENGSVLSRWWYQKAASKKHFGAMFALGQEKLNGQEVEKREGRRLILDAAHGGYIDAMFYLGFCLLHGEGFETDKQGALNWLKKAGDKGHLEARVLCQKWKGGPLSSKKDLSEKYGARLSLSSEGDD